MFSGQVVGTASKIETETENYFCVGSLLQSILWEMSIYANIITFTCHVILSWVKVLEMKIKSMYNTSEFPLFPKINHKPKFD